MNGGLWIFGISKQRGANLAKSGLEVYPEHLCASRGLDWGKLPRDAIYVDEELGFAIGTDRIPRGLSPYLKADFGVFDTTIPLLDDAEPGHHRSHAVALAKRMPPYLSDIYEDWPPYTGRGVRVAVLDSGIGFHQLNPDPLPRDAMHRDFCSAKGEGIATHDMDPSASHGTTIAGVIGARTSARQSIAPDCDVYAAQVTESAGAGGARAYTTTSNMLLMISWAVHCAKAHIINLSFTAGTIGLDAKVVALFGRIATGLRRDNRAMMFASARSATSVLGFPARVDGIIAVGTYLEAIGKSRACVTSVPDPTGWLAKGRELLFGPSADQATFTWDRQSASRGSSSGACAFVSGVAALYLEKYVINHATPLTLDGVLDRMRQDAPLVYDFNHNGWPRAVFP